MTPLLYCTRVIDATYRSNHHLKIFGRRNIQPQFGKFRIMPLLSTLSLKSAPHEMSKDLDEAISVFEICRGFLVNGSEPLCYALGRCCFFRTWENMRGLCLLILPRGSTYTTIRELGPIIPSIVWYFGA